MKNLVFRMTDFRKEMTSWRTGEIISNALYPETFYIKNSCNSIMRKEFTKIGKIFKQILHTETYTKDGKLAHERCSNSKSLEEYIKPHWDTSTTV